jgi:hypothetical protein
VIAKCSEQNCTLKLNNLADYVSEYKDEIDPSYNQEHPDIEKRY